MYIPKQFKISDRAETRAFIQANSFGQLISTVDGRLFSSHIPFLLDETRESLLCHVARANPQWKEIEKQEILVTFQGPHDYISPSWYTSAGVPTWNYQAVHICGSARIIDNPSDLNALVECLTEAHESPRPDPWQSEFKPQLLSAIVGIEIEIEELQCKYKRQSESIGTGERTDHRSTACRGFRTPLQGDEKTTVVTVAIDFKGEKPDGVWL